MGADEEQNEEWRWKKSPLKETPARDSRRGSERIIDRCGPKAAKYASTEEFRLKPRVPLGSDDDKRGEAGSGRPSKASKAALMVGGTDFKRFDVPLMPHIEEKNDECDIAILKAIHFNMKYCDTYAELSGSKVWVVDHYNRGLNLLYVLVYLVFCGMLIQRLDCIREREVRFAMSDGYSMLFNGMWWNFLHVYAYLMIIQSFGFLARLFAVVQHRLYYFFFSLAIPAMTAAYLWREGCGYASPWILWSALIICLMSVGRPDITSRMADPIADCFFFACFVALVLQAICSGDDGFLQSTLLLLLGFGYAGPLGDWGWFPARIALWCYCLCRAFKDVIRAVGTKGGPLTPKTWWNNMKRGENIVKMVMDLPLSSAGCKLKTCEPGLYELFRGGPMDFENCFVADDDGQGQQNMWGLLDCGVDLSFSAEDVLFWIIVLTTTVMAFYVLSKIERLAAQDACLPESATKPIKVCSLKHHSFPEAGEPYGSSPS